MSRIQIPEGHLRTSKYRFESMQRPDWSVPVAVIGADGCFYDYSRDSAILYANDRTVADNTNIFFRGATDSVICCISSTKLTDNPKQGQNSGPPIDSPNVHRNTAVKCYLVTDDVENGENRKIKALKNQGWRIVTKLHDWPQFDRFKPPHWGSQSANS